MKLRSVNKLVHELEKACPDIAAQYFERIGVTRERYHDEFEGRPCSLICRKHEVLRDVVKDARSMFVTKHGEQKRRRVSKRTEPDSNHPALCFADAFQALDGVMRFCYGEQLVRKFEHCIDDFKLAIARIGCSVNVSMHMLIDHTPRFCDKHNSGLLLYSEEAAESLHAECNKHVQ